MVTFSQSMVEFYSKNGIEIPRQMSHREFQCFLAVHKVSKEQ